MYIYHKFINVNAYVINKLWYNISIIFDLNTFKKRFKINKDQLLLGLLLNTILYKAGICAY